MADLSLWEGHLCVMSAVKLDAEVAFGHDKNGWEYEDYLPFGGETKGGEYLLKRK